MGDLVFSMVFLFFKLSETTILVRRGKCLYNNNVFCQPTGTDSEKCLLILCMAKPIWYFWFQPENKIWFIPAYQTVFGDILTEIS